MLWRINSTYPDDKNYTNEYVLKYAQYNDTFIRYNDSNNNGYLKTNLENSNGVIQSYVLEQPFLAKKV